MNPKARTNRSWQAMRNNAQGHFFEGYINAACGYYRDKGVAIVEKIPEPFKTTSTGRDGTDFAVCDNKDTVGQPGTSLGSRSKSGRLRGNR